MQSLRLKQYFRPAVAAAMVMVAGVPAAAQAPAPSAPVPAFEVASVKRNNSGAMGARLGGPGVNRFEATNVTLRQLITFAYGVQGFQVVGGPDWTNSQHFDINAKAPESAGLDGGRNGFAKMPGLVKELIEDRFKVRTHTETRDMPIYALVPARADSSGIKLKAAATDCDKVAAARRGGPPPGPPNFDEPLPCNMMMGPGIINAGSMPLLQLTRALSNLLQRVVVDKTGLTGTYDFQLRFTPDAASPGGAVGPGGDGPKLPAIDPNGASIFTALQEQLGLKLDSQHGPVEVLVIDSVEQPTED